MFSKHLRLFVSKAILMVMVFASLAPTVSHAFANKNGDKNVWQEICTVQGTKRIAASFILEAKESSPASKSNPSAMHFEHCPFCLNHAAVDALPYFNNPAVVVLEEGRFYFQTAYLALVLTAIHLSDNPSRAPPLSIK